ncbi:hypothetical protein HK096_003568 [Nowakowskiella sp. JEL0078]|nr:hypothetical protein HK096_003568 [Nowakowskiella sp. JEL0078]
MASVNSTSSDTLDAAMGKECGLMSISWVRLAFHDFATYNIVCFILADGTGGLDGSILTTEEALYSGNLPLATDESNVIFFQRLSLTNPTISAPDWIALSALVAIRKCGGPDLTPYFRPGRVASYTPNNYLILPERNDTLAKIKSEFSRMGFTNFTEVVTLVLGSHTLGRENSRLGDSDYRVKPALSLDSTPNIFDNNVFTQALNFDGNLTVSDTYQSTNGPQLENDRQLMTDPEAVRYGKAFLKMLDMSQTNLGCYLYNSSCIDEPIANTLTSTPSTWKGLSSELTRMFYSSAPIPTIASEANPTSSGNKTMNLLITPFMDKQTKSIQVTHETFVALLRKKEASPLLTKLKTFLNNFSLSKNVSIQAKRKQIASFLASILDDTLANPLFKDFVSNEFDLDQIKEGWEKAK